MNALVSGRGGVAVLVDGNEFLASIHADEPGRMVQRQPSEIRWLLGEAHDVFPLENVTRKQVEEELKRSSHREESLALALLVLDPALPNEIREQAVQELDDLLRIEGVTADLEAVLFSRPLPAVADLEGAIQLGTGSSDSVSRLFGRLQNLQPLILEVCQAGDDLSFPTKDDQESWRLVAVREGLFRQLVEILAARKKVNLFFLEASMNPMIAALPKHREILHQWIDSLSQDYTSTVDWAARQAQAQLVAEEPEQYDNSVCEKKESEGATNELTVLPTTAIEKVRQYSKPPIYLTERQKEILEFISEFHSDHGVSPTHREIRDTFGYSSFGTVYKHLRLLQEKGYLRRDWNQKRGLDLVRSVPGAPLTTTSEIPFLGFIAAGLPIEALPGGEKLAVPNHLFEGPTTQHYVLKVTGDSMIQEGVFDGDFVVIRRQGEAKPGEMVVALIRGDVTLKRFYPEGNTIRLQPANPVMESIRVPVRDVNVQGVVVGLMRKF